MPRILFLEDEEDLLEYLPTLLKDRGLEVIGTASIADALQWHATEDFDAVLLDIMMTPMEDMNARELDFGRETGLEVARRMKATKPHVPIVAFTVLTDPEIRTQMRHAGIDDIVNKPSELDQIAEALRRVIRSRQ